MGSLTGSDHSGVGGINLTTEGSLAWTKWRSDGSVVKKSGGGGVIGALTPNDAGSLSGTGAGYLDVYTWTDGTGPGSSSEQGGVYYSDTHATITVPAIGPSRRVRLYMANTSSGISVTAHLGDSSASDVTISHDASEGYVEFDFSADESTTLTLTIVAGSTGCVVGAISLYQPVVTLTPPVPNGPSIDTAGTTLTLPWTISQGTAIAPSSDSGTGGLSLSGLAHGAATISAVTSTGTTTTATISRAISSDETPTLNYTPGDFADNLIPLLDGTLYSGSHVASEFSGVAITNNSTAGPPPDTATLTSVLAINKGVILAGALNGDSDPVDVFVGTVTGEESGTPTLTGQTAFPITVRGLTNGTEVFVTVKSKHSGTYSAASAEHSATPQPYGQYV